LRQKLKGPLRRPKIGQVKPGIGIDDPDKRDVREVQPLGDHLCADEDVDISRLDRCQDPLVRPLRAGGIQIHSGDARAGVAIPQHLLELLSAHAAHLLNRVGACSTTERQRLLMAAVVAAQACRRPVHSEGDAAVRTLPYFAAIWTVQEGGIAASIEQQQRLLPPGQAGNNACFQGF
jgi:hypothetical protein